MPGSVFGMTLPVFFVVDFMAIRKTKINFLTIVFLITVSWLISDLLIIACVPDGWNVFKEIYIVRLLSFNLTAIVLYLVISDSERSLELKQRLQYYAQRDSLTGLFNMLDFMETLMSYQTLQRKCI